MISQVGVGLAVIHILSALFHTNDRTEGAGKIWSWVLHLGTFGACIAGMVFLMGNASLACSVCVHPDLLGEYMLLDFVYLFYFFVVYFCYMPIIFLVVACCFCCCMKSNEKDMIAAAGGYNQMPGQTVVYVQ